MTRYREEEGRPEGSKTRKAKYGVRDSGTALARKPEKRPLRAFVEETGSGRSLRNSLTGVWSTWAGNEVHLAGEVVEEEGFKAAPESVRVLGEGPWP